MPKPPSPCIDVCKYKLEGHCIACGMTKKQKSAFKRLSSGAERAAFVVALVAQQSRLGRSFEAWRIAYRRKCAKKGKPCVLDAPEVDGAHRVMAEA